MANRSGVGCSKRQAANSECMACALGGNDTGSSVDPPSSSLGEEVAQEAAGCTSFLSPGAGPDGPRGLWEVPESLRPDGLPRVPTVKWILMMWNTRS